MNRKRLSSHILTGDPDGKGRVADCGRGEDPLTRRIIGGAIEVHRELGPGLLESVYEECLCAELQGRGLLCERQKSIPIAYKGKQIDTDLRIDLLVEGEVVCEIKAVENLLAVH